MTFPDYLTELPDGEITLTGHRVSLYDIVTAYNEGLSPEMLAEEFPTITLAVIHKVIAFYLENREQVDTYCRTYRTEIEQQMKLPRLGPDLVELRRRLEARLPMAVIPQGF